MERGTEIISAVIETTLLSGMVDRQHDREHASADAFDVDADLLTAEFEIGPAGLGARTMVRAAGLGACLVDGAAPVAEQRARPLQRRALLDPAPCEGVPLGRGPGDDCRKLRRGGKRLNELRGDQHLMGGHADETMAAGIAPRPTGHARPGGLGRGVVSPIKMLLGGREHGEEVPGVPRLLQACQDGVSRLLIETLLLR